MSIARSFACAALILCGCDARDGSDAVAQPWPAPRLAFDATTFPGDDWTVTPAAEAGWDPADLEAVAQLAEGALSTGLCVVYQGRLLLARQWKPDDSVLDEADREAFRWTFRGQRPSGRFVQDVTSIQKSVVALLMARARERGDLDYDDALTEGLDPTSSDLAPELAAGVRLRHLLTMTADMQGGDRVPGSRWAYDPRAPHLLLEALVARTGRDLDDLLAELSDSLGADSLAWARYPEFPGVVGLTATDLDLARIGLCVQELGRWGESAWLAPESVAELVRPSQAHNPNYGMLWMLNRPGAVLPGGERLQRRPLPHAPADLAIAQGRSDCALMVSPSERLVVVRFGARVPGRGGALGAGMDFWDELWRLLMEARPHE